jgi:hypothetical protein
MELSDHLNNRDKSILNFEAEVIDFLCLRIAHERSVWDDDAGYR